MQYILVMQQSGGWCDYTIGCGIKYWIFTADDHPNAKEIAKEYVQNNHHPGSEGEIERAYLAELPSTLPVKEWYDELKEENIKAKEEKIKRQELAELDRLKAKYSENS